MWYLNAEQAADISGAAPTAGECLVQPRLARTTPACASPCGAGCMTKEQARYVRLGHQFLRAPDGEAARNTLNGRLPSTAPCAHNFLDKNIVPLIPRLQLVLENGWDGSRSSHVEPGLRHWTWGSKGT